jgi:hypothetical protein
VGRYNQAACTEWLQLVGCRDLLRGCRRRRQKRRNDERELHAETWPIMVASPASLYAS